MSDEFTGALKTETRTPVTDQQRLMEAMDFSPIQELLKDNTPQLIPGELGRLRLTKALQQQFGDGFRSNVAAQSAIKHFDGETDRAKEILRLRGALNNGV